MTYAFLNKIFKPFFRGGFDYIILLFFCYCEWMNKTIEWTLIGFSLRSICYVPVYFQDLSSAYSLCLKHNFLICTTLATRWLRICLIYCFQYLWGQGVMWFSQALGFDPYTLKKNDNRSAFYSSFESKTWIKMQT